MSKSPAKPKYGNKQKAASDGKVFSSQRECRRYEELLLLYKMGKITQPECQVAYELIPKQDGERSCVYLADFVYRDVTPAGIIAGMHVEDTKGFRTKEYVIKRKLMLWVHKIRIEEI